MKNTPLSCLSCTLLWICLGAFISLTNATDTLHVQRMLDDRSKPDLEQVQRELSAKINLLDHLDTFDFFNPDSPIMSNLGLPAKRDGESRIGQLMPLYLLMQNSQNHQEMQDRIEAISENERLFADGGKRKKRYA